MLFIFNNLFIRCHKYESQWKKVERENNCRVHWAKLQCHIVPFLSWTSKHKRFPEVPVTGSSYHGMAQWNQKMTKAQHEPSSKPKVVMREVWDCSAILCEPHARNHSLETSLCLQMEREWTLTLMKTYYFDTSVKAHCFALSLVFSNPARYSLQSKSACKKFNFC